MLVRQSAFVAGMRTDCLSLIATAAAGVAKATDPRRVLAKIWVLIANALDGDLHVLADHRTLVWIPAHTNPTSIGEVSRSDGRRFSHVDWRANRLADALAKQAAAKGQPPSSVIRLLTSAMHASRHAAKLLGQVTFAANNHQVQAITGDGLGTSRTIRDSVDAPRRTRAPVQVPAATVAAADASASSSTQPCQVQPCHATKESQVASRRRPSHASVAHAAESAAVKARVAEIGASLRTPVDRASGADRLQALREHVRSRVGTSQ